MGQTANDAKGITTHFSDAMTDPGDRSGAVRPLWTRHDDDRRTHRTGRADAGGAPGEDDHE